MLRILRSQNSLFWWRIQSPNISCILLSFMKSTKQKNMNKHKNKNSKHLRRTSLGSLHFNRLKLLDTKQVYLNWGSFSCCVLINFMSLEFDKGSMWVSGVIYAEFRCVQPLAVPEITIFVSQEFGLVNLVPQMNYEKWVVYYTKQLCIEHVKKELTSFRIWNFMQCIKFQQ